MDEIQEGAKITYGGWAYADSRTGEVGEAIQIPEADYWIEYKYARNPRVAVSIMDGDGVRYLLTQEQLDTAVFAAAKQPTTST
jgi:hypothetical protein